MDPLEPFFEEQNHIFPTGRFVSEKNFCEYDQNILYFNFGTSLLGTHFKEATTIKNSLSLLDKVLFYLSRYLIINATDYDTDLFSEFMDEQNYRKHNFIKETGKVSFFSEDIMNKLNDIYKYHINNVFFEDFEQMPITQRWEDYFETSFKIHSLSLEEPDHEESLHDEQDNYKPYILEEKDKSIYNCIKYFFNPEKETQETMLNSVKTETQKFKKWVPNEFMILDDNSVTLVVVIFGMGPIGLLTAYNFFKLSILYKYKVKIILVENRITESGIRQPFSRDFILDIVLDNYDDLAKELLKQSKINDKQSKLLDFLYYISKSEKIKNFQIKFVYENFTSLDEFKTYVNNNLENDLLKPSANFVLFNCTSKVDLFGFSKDNTELKTFLEKDGQKYKFKLNNKFYLKGEKDNFCIKLKPNGDKKPLSKYREYVFSDSYICFPDNPTGKNEEKKISKKDILTYIQTISQKKGGKNQQKKYRSKKVKGKKYRSKKVKGKKYRSKKVKGKKYRSKK